MMTEKTLQVLKNYATINPNIVIENGNVVKTISEARAIVSKSSVDVDFPSSFFEETPLTKCWKTLW